MRAALALRFGLACRGGLIALVVTWVNMYRLAEWNRLLVAENRPSAE
jgi:hypothetical protein